jgi:hypothetical protein
VRQTAAVVAWIALALSLAGIAWQVYVWMTSRRYDVRVRIEPLSLLRAGDGKVEVDVVVTNMGSTTEALDLLSLLYTGKPNGHVVVDRSVNGERLEPRHHFRKTYDLWANPYVIAPAEVIALVRLQSDRREVSGPYPLYDPNVPLALQGRETPAEGSGDDA